MPFASACLACDLLDKGEENFEQHLPRNQKAPTVGEAGAGVSTYSAEAPAADGGAGGPDAPSSPPERARLQEFVKEFAKQAVRGYGINCEVVDSATGGIFSAFYSVDAELKKLTLRRSQPQANQESVYREVELARIKDILDFEAARASLPDSVLRAVDSEAMRDRLLFLSFSDGSPAANLLEGSAVDRDRFMMCVKILKLFAQTHGRTGGPSR